MMKRIVMMALAAGLFVCVGGNAQAQCSKGEKAACCAKKQEKPTISELKRDDVVKMVQASNVTIIDARDADSYAKGHINGAINYGSATLPADKNASLVFYCGGLKCPAAAKAAKKALEMGYKNVMVYRGGWADWSQGQS